jgi:hypothetical protein
LLALFDGANDRGSRQRRHRLGSKAVGIVQTGTAPPPPFISYDGDPSCSDVRRGELIELLLPHKVRPRDARHQGSSGGSQRRGGGADCCFQMPLPMFSRL